MSAQWSLTYLNTSMPIDMLFDQLTKIFQQTIVGRLHHTLWLSGNEEIRLDSVVAEKFQESQRAKLIFESCEVGVYNRGVILYPQREGLFTVYDSVNLLDAVWMANRSERERLLAEKTSNSEAPIHPLILYEAFLCRLTKSLSCDAIHVLFERNPAGRSTSVRFFGDGKLRDDFCHSYIDGGEWELLEMPQHPQVVRTVLNGRFAFLLDQPKRYISPIDHEEYKEYFDGQHLKPNTPEWDVFDIQAQHLYVPFWYDDFIPYGAVYCPAKELPSHLLDRYKP